MNDVSYSNWASLNDKALSVIIGRFVRHHRLKQNLSQDRVAHLAGISRSTLSILERGGKVTLATVIQVLRVLDLLHVLEVFRVYEQPSPIAYAERLKKQRKHASGVGVVEDPGIEEDLGW